MNESLTLSTQPFTLFWENKLWDYNLIFTFVLTNLKSLPMNRLYQHSIQWMIFISCCFIISAVEAQNFNWAKSQGGSSEDTPSKIVLDNNGNIVEVGQFNGTADVDPGPGIHNLVSAGGQDVFIVKLDASGNYLWSYNIGSSGGEVAGDVQCDGNGNIYITGWYSGQVDFDPGPNATVLSSFSGTQDLFILKLSSSGTFLFAKSIGGSGYDAGNNLTLDSLNNIYVSGNYLNTVDFDPGAGVANLSSNGIDDFFVLKLDSQGNFVWAKSFGGIGNEYAFDIRAGNGGVVVTGLINSITDMDPGPAVYNLTPSVFNSYVLKLSYSGNLIWAKLLFGNANNYITGLAFDHASNVLVCGHFGGGNVDFDPGPAVYTLSEFSGNQSSFVLKLDPSGNFLLAGKWSGNGNLYCNDIQSDDSSNYYVGGAFNGLADFNPGSGVYSLSSKDTTGKGDAYLMKLNAAGDFVWAKGIGGYEADELQSILVDGARNIYAAGKYRGSVDFDPPNNVNLSSVSPTLSDVFLLKYSQPCAAPSGLTISNIARYSAKMNWSAAAGVTQYQVRYRPTGTTTWLYKSSTNAYKFLTGLTAGTPYQCQVRSKCSISPLTWSEWIPKVSFTTSPPLADEVLQKDMQANGMSEISLDVFPVPAHDKISVQLTGMSDGTCSVTLINILGQPVYKGQFASADGYTEAELDIALLLPGIYFMEVSNQQETVSTRLLIE